MIETLQKTNLLLGFHGHLSSDTERELDHIKNYVELITLLNNFQNLKITIHFSGSLISYLDKNFSDFSNKIRTLLDRNQIELFGGGRYEPIFPFIPKEDRQSQLLLMNRLLDHTFGYTPNGAWITESVWEPSLALDFAKSRIQYACLSKDYFISQGIEEKDIFGYYLTEEEGRKLAIFPISNKLNSLMMKYTPQELINNISENTESSFVLIYEGLIDSVDKLSWLNTFFQLLEKDNKNIETKLFNDYFINNKPTGRIYLPTLQDIKLQDISLPSKNFLLKCHEANLLHKKMLRVSKKINSAKEGKSRFKVIKEMISQAQDLLLKGQNSAIYCNYNFNGIYSPYERHSTYSNLIKAENLIDAASRQGSSWIQASETDYDCDGNDEIIIETESQNIYLSSALGGTILEHDFRPKNINLTNTISQEKEPLKLSLIDHFLPTSTTLQECKLSQMKHLTKEIIYPYQVEKIKAKEETCKVTFTSNINLINLENTPDIELKKQINVRSGDSSMVFNYTLTNKSHFKAEFLFGIEFNLNIAPKGNEESYFYLNGDINSKTPDSDLKSTEELNEINQISACNKTLGIIFNLSWNHLSTLFRFPIETMTLKDKKLEKLFQGTTILPTWHLILEPETTWELLIKEDITTISDFDS